MYPGFASQYVGQMRGVDFSRDFRAVAGDRLPECAGESVNVRS